ncbi:phage virion morphogenesis protein [Erwinia tracheiphila]|uniref:Phage virion morphogenesis protein n=1 Tax=Erwinia tracheiphila TaxID=65700 RepID=A0A0M2KF11_9GAMM|nr:phage virion morphogenesis protein [Erwinia tracheiphila]AXF77455.1 phage virion morphogenesis protein [Erwinia tracheiphila]EOS92602.1 phage virion morphogenesis protein [Erwinia tracheiphila PSU-1]KKF35838.1 tail protein [Erwinia tracheiphila]UIA83848.1 phage virion morphogenesis protein [Erwinia tracheiphila]UIA86109.1 phage virion morphogenesis protein [Erwinia tracheiphila]
MNQERFRELDQVFSGILSGTSQAGRTLTARAVGQALKRSQQQRIKAQKNPDGSPWAARRRRVLRSQQGIVFVWQGEIRRLKNWHGGQGKYGRTLTGFDEERNAIRTFYRSDIERYIEINTRSVRRSTAKKVPMFQRLRGYRFLKMRADGGGTSVGYDGVAARIARVHQYGQRDQVGPGAFAKYPVRELLGFTAGDDRMITERVINSLGSVAR